jgi:hypothetical protein
VVNISSELKGTHQEELDLTGLNMGMIPVTNKLFATGCELSKLTLHGGRQGLFMGCGTEQKRRLAGDPKPAWYQSTYTLISAKRFAKDKASDSNHLKHAHLPAY